MSTPSENRQSTRTIKTQRIEIVDEHDNVRITLDGVTNGPVIRLWGKDGTLKASLGMLKHDQPSLIFWSGEMTMMDLRLQEDEDATLGLINSQTRKGVAMLMEVLERSYREKVLERAHQEKQKTAVVTPKRTKAGKKA